MTDEELIARLLDWEEYDEGDINDAREAAANRIKELKAELAGGSFYQEKDIDALQNRISAQAAEIERLRSYLDRIEKASEFFTNPEHSELTLRYAHEGTQRLAREALTGAKP